MTLRLVDSLVSTEALADVFSDSALVAAMLQFEVALARVEARLGLIPTTAADAIGAAAADAEFDASAIARAARRSATIVIPFVELLRERVRVCEPAAATFVHWGATSQDVSDTALVLCLVRARVLLVSDHVRATRALRRLSDRHAGAVMLARTLLQPAPPTTFGLKAAGWFGGLSRSGGRMAAAFDEAAVLQFGGASGTLAALGADGPAVAAELARELKLKDPGGPWHALRDRLASVVTACGVYTGMLGKIARDVALLMQEEVAEAAEPGGSSSTMPHKRNPAGCALALAAAVRVPALVSAFLSGLLQEHERGVGGWQAETSTVCAVVQATGSAVAAMADVLEKLTIDRDRMRANLLATRGVVFAERAMMLLAPLLGHDAATRVINAAVERARLESRSFAAVLVESPEVRAVIDPSTLTDLDRPEAYLGAAEQLRLQLIAAEPED